MHFKVFSIVWVHFEGSSLSTYSQPSLTRTATDLLNKQAKISSSVLIIALPRGSVMYE